jgi:hypothetical protein
MSAKSSASVRRENRLPGLPQGKTITRHLPHPYCRDSGNFPIYSLNRIERESQMTFAHAHSLSREAMAQIIRSAHRFITGGANP